MMIYKILRAEEWVRLEQDGVSDGAPIDVSDGFIHFSTAEQVSETAAKHFAGEEDLILAAVEADPLGDELKWEISRGGASFPHLYRQMKTSDILWVQPLALVNGAHIFPEDLS